MPVSRSRIPLVREPPITITCDCKAVASVQYGKRWTCDSCGRTWDTNRIPRAEYDALLQSVRHYRTLTVGPPLTLAVILLPLAVLLDLRFAFLLFVLVLAHGLLVLPHLRRRATERVLEAAPRWELRSE